MLENKKEMLMFFDYALIMLSTVMFGVCFVCNDAYRRRRGESVMISLQYTLISCSAGLALFLVMNGFRFDCTPFLLVLSFINAFIGFGFSYCSFRSLGVIKLSLYSLFSMLGGMVLPFLQGILF